ncbi:cobaltochelatase subunit CobN [Dehalococcoidia bacterium]|nr:cobaltochelatase subunit CobN [Dehalococcoidia bacterium]
MEKAKIAYFTTNQTDVVPLISAIKAITEEKGEIANVCLRTGEDFMQGGKLEEFTRFATKSHLLIIHLHGGKKSFPEFDRFMSSLEGKGIPIHAQGMATEQDIELIKLSTVDKDDYQRISRYINYGGTENFKNLLLYAANRFAGAEYEVGEPERPSWEGIYHPDFDYLPTLDEYLEKKHIAGRLTVGLWFYQTFWQAKNTVFVDRLIEEIEKQGANVIPVFLYAFKDVDLGTKGPQWVVENYFMKDGEPLVDVLISPLMFSMSMSEGSEAPQGNEGFLKRLKVPIIKAILTHNTLEEWRDTPQGLSPIDVTMSIALPEFDGMLITVPVAARKFSDIDPLTGAKIVRYEPIAERVSKVVRLSLNWARLRHIPSNEKKVAIIFHNYPPRNDTIGTAFGLDSPVSVWNILRDLKEAGYKLDYLPENGQILIEDIIERATNDRRWASSEEMAKRAVGKVSHEQYTEWFQELPSEVQNKMIQAWGKPPGKLFSHKNRLLIPGLINGNIFIGLQPPRGFSDDPAAIYHSPDHPIPHHYYAYYRWIRDVFKADVVMHIGKHGSLEWLPGKSAGLSESCFPDITISDLPNIYPYIINNPGEGTQAKRRSYCCIIDHLVAVMHNADTYDEIAGVEVLIDNYYQATAEDRGKIPELQKMIWEKVCQAKLDHDLGIDQAVAFADFDGFMEKLHGYIHELADTQIRDGLHTLGEPPVDSRLDEFLVALTRLSNGDVPSLRQSLAEGKGYDYDNLLANRGKLQSDGKSGGHIIEELHELSLQLVKRFHDDGFREESIDAIAGEVLGESNFNIKRVLTYIMNSIVPNLAATTDELTNTLLAASGGFIPPGPSGAPTRGMADILPTGRNFYSVDPQSIPSPAAWRVGVALGDALLERYLKDEGEYPESIGIIIWGSSTMRTKGDDIAEIFYLMGVKPIWEESSGRVKGIEVIPLEELGRPRIDVALRISGLFRDAFPNIVHLIDEAVEMIASLDEPPERNYLAKHVREETEEKIATGMSFEQAKEEASYRVFGCKPGAYGAGVSDAIDAKNWKDEKDLGEIYVVWGGYAYGRKNYGITVPEQFKRRLSQLDIAVKNHDTREHDMLDSDDFYSYHGGMIAAVKAFKGELPSSYRGDNSDPDRVKIRSTAEETKHIFRARVLNPKWIESMKRHGYKGAGDLSRLVDIAFGWDATAEVLEDWMYEELAKKYTLDKEMQEWLKEVNPYALQNIAERLLEAIERDMWQATEEMKEKLRQVYLDIEGVLEESTARGI